MAMAMPVKKIRSRRLVLTIGGLTTSLTAAMKSFLPDYKARFMVRGPFMWERYRWMLLANNQS
jgi:hypothetical protein